MTQPTSLNKQIYTCAVNFSCDFKCCICDCDGTAYKEKNWRLSLSLKCLLSEHFQAVEEEDVTQSKKPYIPDIMCRATDWTVRMFEQWRDFYNSRQSKYKSICPVSCVLRVIRNIGFL